MNMKEKIERMSEKIPFSGCWIWTGAFSSSKGYGQIRAGDKKISAHRASYEAFNGPIKEGFFVCHRCDVRLCVNPCHLFQGTAKDNAQDMVDKGRCAVTRQKITGQQTAEILRRYSEGESPKRLAAEFGIAREYVHQLSRKHGS